MSNVLKLKVKLGKDCTIDHELKIIKDNIKTPFKYNVYAETDHISAWIAYIDTYEDLEHIIENLEEELMCSLETHELSEVYSALELNNYSFLVGDKEYKANMEDA